MLKTFFVNSLKFLVAGLLIGWLLKSGKLDFNLLAKLKNHSLTVLIAVFLSVLNFWFISLRWKSILMARAEMNLPSLGIFKITWIGQFFSSVLPGSVSGDLVKIIYLQKLNPSFSKKFLFASILIDRLMGLSGLILLVGFSSLCFSRHILENAPAMKPLLDMNYLLAILVLVALCLFVFCHQLIKKFLVKAQYWGFPEIWKKIIGLWDDLGSIKSQMLKAVLLSLVIQIIGVIIFWSLIQPFLDGHMDFVQALAFIPIGLMTLALPIAPSGLGVGHAIFQKLFEFSAINNGASLFNLFFVVTLTVNVMGVIPYLLNRKQIKK